MPIIKTMWEPHGPDGFNLLSSKESVWPGSHVLITGNNFHRKSSIHLSFSFSQKIPWVERRRQMDWAPAVGSLNQSKRQGKFLSYGVSRLEGMSSMSCSFSSLSLWSFISFPYKGSLRTYLQDTPYDRNSKHRAVGPLIIDVFHIGSGAWKMSIIKARPTQPIFGLDWLNESGPGC